jgi:hypothetical protein
MQDTEKLALVNTQDVSLTIFRAELTQLWEHLQTDLDCVFVTYHSRRTMGFVSPRFTTDLPIPVEVEVSRKLLCVKSEIFFEPISDK